MKGNNRRGGKTGGNKQGQIVAITWPKSRAASWPLTVAQVSKIQDGKTDLSGSFEMSFAASLILGTDFPGTVDGVVEVSVSLILEQR